MKSLFSSENKGSALSAKQLKKLARWEKERAEGKWFWIFRRASIWFVSLILLFAFISFAAPEQIIFSANHFLVVAAMLVGYVVDSLIDWSKMEKLYGSLSLTND
jgi:hypothetical protein